jgi:Cu/Ag efflux protein CusF
MNMKRMLSTLAVGMSLFFGMPAWADVQHMERSGATNHAAMNAMFSEGLVKKVDKAQGKITLKHGPLHNMDMPGMTMVFRVQDAGWLDQVQPGDKVRFVAERVNGALTVTQLETVK